MKFKYSGAFWVCVERLSTLGASDSPSSLQRRRVDTNPSRRSRARYTNNPRTTLACAVDGGEDRWPYRFEKVNLLDDSGDLAALLATALAFTPTQTP